MIIEKNEFVKIINRLKETDDLVKDINKKLRNTTEAEISDFTNAASLMICHEDIVVKLLETMFNDTDMLSWWLYELDYGRQYKKGCIRDCNGIDIDVSTAEKLYDFLIQNLKAIE